MLSVLTVMSVPSPRQQRFQ